MKRSTMVLGILTLVMLAVALAAVFFLPVWSAKDDQSSGLPLPSSLPLDDYEQQLYAFLFERRYAKLNWAVDRKVRDTGPFILKANYGTHPAVRIYYSPGILDWLENNRKGNIPDGAMIIKEMFAPPAARYDELRVSLDAKYPNDPGKADAEFEAALIEESAGWTVMIKDRRLSKDGWFWAGPGQGSTPDTHGYPFNYPASGSGLGTCLRCHASAESESTFISLNNIKGFEQHGEPLRFRVDNAWRTDLLPQQRPAAGKTEEYLIANAYQHMPEALRPQPRLKSPALTNADAAFVKTFNPQQTTSDGKPVWPEPATDNIQIFSGQWADHVPAAPGGAEQFITSDNCVGCHGGLGGAPSGISMFVKTGPKYGDGYNVSPFGEWRWSPMGLAGRDPIFFAQLESELALLSRDARSGLFPEKELPANQQALVNTCLSCHGAMGQRQLTIDAHKKPELTDNNFYYPDYVMLADPLTKAQEDQQKRTMVNGLNGKHSVYPYHKYGNLAREGISCMVCHHINPPNQWTDNMPRNEKLSKFLLHSTTGAFPYSPPDKLNGPFADVKTKPMEHSLGIRPESNPYIQDSKMCGSCHVINLPNVDASTKVPLHGLSPKDQEVLNQTAKNAASRPEAVPLSKRLTGFQHSIEQATYLEWENSDFAWDPKIAQSCQDCHMPGGLHTTNGQVSIDQLTTQIATIQDSSYPESEHDLPDADINIPLRNNYKRHELVGLNVFLLEMFNQFDKILGIDKSDPMTYATNGNQLAIDNMLRQARENTVALDVRITSVGEGSLEAQVDVTNKVGHRFPSGVSFRRAFLEVLVVREIDGKEQVVWGSGRTNSVGVIVDANGKPLKTEFLDQDDPESDLPLYQTHHAVITSQDQVQIYEELTLNARNQFTTSFIHRDIHPKDNRLLPIGFIDPEKDPTAFKKRFGEDETIKAFMKATSPEGATKEDKDFGPGKDTVKYQIALPKELKSRDLTVKATMYYQAIPPYWLRQRFSLAPDQPGTQRLYYLTSHLNTKGTPIKSWKLPLVSATASVAKYLAK